MNRRHAFRELYRKWNYCASIAFVDAKEYVMVIIREYGEMSAAEWILWMNLI
jgi:hypothetical protein